MADDFNFNDAPDRDEEIDMEFNGFSDPGSSDDGGGDGEPRLFGIESELMGEEPGSEDGSVDSEEAEFRRRVHALLELEAEESGASDDNSESGDGESDDDDDDEHLGFGLEPYADHEDDSDDSDDSESSPGRGFLDQDVVSVSDDEDDDDDGESDISQDTDDSWDEIVEYNDETDIIGTRPSDERERSLRQQQRYRADQDRYREQLERSGKRLEFTKFGQLPPELRLRIWELHCSDMQRSHRVLQMHLEPDGFVTPGPTMAALTRRVRHFMRISQETRALGERYLPDVLPVGCSPHDHSTIRFNAQSDIVNFLTETREGLSYASKILAAASADRKGTQARMKTLPAPFTNVRNVALLDMEIRSRAPGSYIDRVRDQHFIEMVSRENASHQQPSELRSAEFYRAFAYLFPNLDNVYVLEHGAARRIDRWIGNTRSYERYHFRYHEEDLDTHYCEAIDYLYCWHAPPKGFVKRPALPPLEEKEEKEGKEEEKQEAPQQADGGEGSSESSQPATKEEDKEDKEETKEEVDDGDFKDECVINHFSDMRRQGVRFSRLLLFEMEIGMEDYCTLRYMTCPDGTWPNDPNGEPEQDAMPSIHDDRLQYPRHNAVDDTDDTDDSIVVSDDDEDETSSSDSSSGSSSSDSSDSDEDDLEILGSENMPLEAIFSSPEPESGDDDEEDTNKANRSRKRRVVTDSDDEEDGEEEEAEAGPSRRSKKRRVIESDDDDDNDDEVQVTKVTNKRMPIVIDDDDDDGEAEEDDEDNSEDSSSQTAEGDEEDSDEEEEHPKKLSLMQMLQQNRKRNPVSDEEPSGSEGEDGEAQEYGGDYGGGAEDDEEEED